MDVTLLGSVAMWVASAVALMGVAASVRPSSSPVKASRVGHSRSITGRVFRGRSTSPRVLAAMVVLLTTAVACLAWALVTGDFRLIYVAEASSRASSAPYRLAGLWGGMAGSLLFWTWLLALVAVVAVRSVRRSRPDLEAPVGAVLAALVGAFLAVGLAWADPFTLAVAGLARPSVDAWCVA